VSKTRHLTNIGISALIVSECLRSGLALLALRHSFFCAFHRPPSRVLLENINSNGETAARNVSGPSVFRAITMPELVVVELAGTIASCHDIPH